jgi:hypothetical protein
LCRQKPKPNQGDDRGGIELDRGTGATHPLALPVGALIARLPSRRWSPIKQ